MESVIPFEFNLCLCFFGNRQIRWKVAWKPLNTNTKHPDFVLSIANNSISVTVSPLTYAVCSCLSVEKQFGYSFKVQVLAVIY